MATTDPGHRDSNLEIDLIASPVGPNGTVKVLSGPPSAGPTRVGWPFLLLLFMAFTGVWIPLLAPILVTLSLRVNELVGPEQAGAALGAIAAPAGLAALLGNPIFGRLSDRTTSRW